MNSPPISAATVFLLNVFCDVRKKKKLRKAWLQGMIKIWWVFTNRQEIYRLIRFTLKKTAIILKMWTVQDNWRNKSLNWQIHCMKSFHINLNHKTVFQNQLNWIQAWLFDIFKKDQHLKKLKLPIKLEII